MANKKDIVIGVDDDIYGWLEEKSRRGYKKASLIRHILRKQMDFEKGPHPSSSGVAE